MVIYAVLIIVSYICSTNNFVQHLQSTSGDTSKSYRKTN